MEIDHEYCLLRIGDGPISHILSYLTADELAAVEATCETVAKQSWWAWKTLDEAVPLNSRSFIDDCKLRALRYHIADRFTTAMAELATKHFDFDDPERSHVRCGGCRCMPDLDRRVLKCASDYEFFVRLAYRRTPCLFGAGATLVGKTSSPIIWQGFLPAWQTRFNAVYFPLDQIGFKWPILEAYLRLLAQRDGLLTTDHPEVLALLYEAIDNVAVTVVAVNKATHIPSLLVATGGFHDRFLETDQSQRYLLRPRNVAAHARRRDEDYMNVALALSAPVSRLQPGRLQGLTIAHEW